MRDAKYPTIIHERVEMARRGENRTVVGRMKSGWVVFGDDQRLAGYTLLLADPVRETINALSMEERIQFLRDMTIVGDALLEVTGASLINYAILGNTDRALHAHIHPRYDNEDPEKRKTWPGIYHWMKVEARPIDLERDGAMMGRLREAIGKRGVWREIE